MIVKNKNYLEKNNFKNILWNKVSDTCPDEIEYFQTEKTIFFVLFSMTFVLGFVYFSGFTNELLEVYKTSRYLNEFNKAKLQHVNSTLTPSNTTLDMNKEY